MCQLPPLLLFECVCHCTARVLDLSAGLCVADGEPQGVEVGKISFSPVEVLGHGAEGTFVFRSALLWKYKSAFYVCVQVYFVSVTSC